MLFENFVDKDLKLLNFDIICATNDTFIILKNVNSIPQSILLPKNKGVCFLTIEL